MNEEHYQLKDLFSTKGLRQIVEQNMAETPGRAGRGLNGSTTLFLLDEIDRLQSIIDQHDLCHDLHGKVGVNEFATGCEREQRKLFGRAPHADSVKSLRRRLLVLAIINVIMSVFLIFKGL